VRFMGAFIVCLVLGAAYAGSVLEARALVVYLHTIGG
jgi:hypothetical protein